MLRASIVGATGFTGAVLTDLLARHPQVQLGALTSTSYAGRRVAEVFPHLRVEAEYQGYDAVEAARADVAFVCYPHAQSHPVVAELVDAGVRVVDLSADFRLTDPTAYDSWYGFVHPRPDLVAEGVYGLPEVYRTRLRDARVVANPGCFPTALLLALLPLAADGGTLAIVDAKSGVSGAGRTPTDKTHFCAVHDDFKAYSEIGHRHTPEMAQELSAAAGAPVRVSFTPHLLPVDRGILSTVYWPLAGGNADLSDGELTARYRSFYGGEPFVEVVDAMPALREVQQTNYCRLAVRVDHAAGLIKVVSVIDNLVKGASGQAVQNMNVMFGLNETLGLERKV
jgi:N-acetyl-gamma-glutamyl-phosphate reductase